jgi:carboxybiotin decarboxylase
MWDKIVDIIDQILSTSGIASFFQDGGWQNLVMVLIALLLLFLAIKKQYEPYLLIPIASGMLLVNLFPDLMGIFNQTKSIAGIETPTTADQMEALGKGQGGLFDYLYLGVKFEIYPCLIFLGIGATTDFGPLIANKKTMLLGAAAQFGIFTTFLGAIALGEWGLFPDMTFGLAASIGIIGGADGPTAILVTSKLAPTFLASISIAAYSYMALVPVIQPPIIRLLTTRKERRIRMEQLRPVTKKEKILFPIIVMVVCILLVPSCAPLIGCLMLGNLIKESGVVPNLVTTVSNALLYIVTILLGLSVGGTAIGSNFLSLQTILIFVLGILAFAMSTAFGVLGGKIMCAATHGKVNPMIGAAGVSAVPMAARVVQKEGQREDPENFLLMHAMGPNVAGVIGSAVAAGILLAIANFI